MSGFSPLSICLDLSDKVEEKWKDFGAQNSGWQGRLVVPFKGLYNAVMFFELCLIGTIELAARLAYHYLVEKIFINETDLDTAKDALVHCFVNLLATPLSFPVNWIYGSYIGITEGPQKQPQIAPGVTLEWWGEFFRTL